jgi:hypothetical protein
MVIIGENDNVALKDYKRQWKKGGLVTYTCFPKKDIRDANTGFTSRFK